MRTIETYAEAKRIPAGGLTQIGNMTVITNEGQSCIALIPRWASWGTTLEETAKLKGGDQ